MLLQIALIIIVVGVLLWPANQYIPTAAPIKQILNIVVIIVLVLWLLQVFGLLPAMGNVRLR
jgi:hypothetical protein